MDLSAFTDEELAAIAGSAPESAPPAPAVQANAPRGIRNNNPLNLTALPGQQSDGRFRTFATMDEGVQAADRNLQVYANKHGLNTVQGVITRWAPPSENDTGSYVQTVANKLGVDPTAPLDMQDPTVRHQLMTAMAEVENGQPVDLGGSAMPQADLSGFTDEELAAIAGEPIAKPPAPKTPASMPRTVSRSGNGGVTVEALGPAPARQDRGLIGNAYDAASTAASKLGSYVAQDYKRASSGKPGDFFFAPKVLGGLANIPLAAIGSVQNDLISEPLARQMDKIPLQAYAGPKLSLQGGRPTLSAPRALSPEETHAANLASVNQALMAGRPSAARSVAFLPAARQASLAQAPVAGGNLTQQVRAVTPQMPVPPRPVATPSVDELRTQKQAAYKRAEQSGITIAPNDAQKLAADVRAIVDAKGGEDLYPTASKMATRLENLSQKGITPTQLDDYRGQIYEQLMADGGKEYGIGKDIRSVIDGVMSNDPRWAEARASNMRYEKVKEITDRLESADIQGDTNLGGAGNALGRQKKLKPLIDPKSAQRMYNLTPAESKALSTAVRGTAGSKATRYAGQFMKNRFIQGASLASMGPLGLPGVAAPLALDVAGTLLTKSGEAQTAKQIDNLLRIMATGSAKAAPATAAAAPSVQDLAAALQAIQILRPKPADQSKTQDAKRGR